MDGYSEPASHLWANVKIQVGRDLYFSLLDTMVPTLITLSSHLYIPTFIANVGRISPPENKGASKKQANLL